jgi:hypothetical protein
MDLNQWRAEVKELAGRMRQRLSSLVQRTEQMAPGVIYGATAGMAVLPLVAAAQSGALPYGELAALLGGMGINLLSSELYDWRKRKDAQIEQEQIEQELPARLAELATTDAAWRELLDKLLQAAQVEAAVQSQLGAAAAPYLAALQQDAARLGSRLIVANVSGAKYVQIGDGDMTISETTNNYFGPQPPISFADVVRLYLARERRICDELPLAKPKADARRIPRMQRVFVELRTTLPVDETTWFDRLGVAPDKRAALRRQLQRKAGGETAEMRRVGGAGPEREAEQAWFAELHRLDDEKLAPIAAALGATPAQVRAARHPLTPLEVLAGLRRHEQSAHLLLLGDPGGGKSTWVRRLTSVLAWLRLRTQGDAVESLGQEESAWLQAAQAALGESPTPIRIAMHRWASLVRRGELKLTGAAADLVAVCANTLKQDYATESISVQDSTLALLKQGQALILLDGLDEVADDSQRTKMIAAVRAFCAEASYHRTPLLITCRSKPYARLKDKGQAVLADGHVCTLGALDDDAIHRFVDLWCAEMSWAERGEPAKLQADARRLHDALPVRADLQRMAGTPLLLTMMARTNQESGLPDGRAELYENLVHELLWEWEERRAYGEEGDAAPQPEEPGSEPTSGGRSLLGILHATNTGLGEPDVEKALNQLAYEVHGRAGGEAVEIERRTLEEHFARLAPCAADDGKGKARAAELATNIVNFIGQRSGLLIDIEDGLRFRFTHYTFQEYLAARWIASGSHAKRLQKMRECIDDVHWREAVFLALGCLVSEVREAYDEAILLVEALLRHAAENEQDRQRLLLLGEAFVRQCTPAKLRLAVDEERSREVVDLVAARLCSTMQTRSLAAAVRLEAGLLLDDLRGQHGLSPPGLDDFIAVPNSRLRIGKYPVTNRQFRRFVDAGGYGDAAGRKPAWWSEQGWRYRRSNDWKAPRYWDDRRFNRDTQPVVGVSWWEADAYRDWLNNPASAAHLPGGKDYLPAEHRARLPSQEEWMAAARNRRPAPAEDLDYPWRGTFEPERANTEESNLQQTTPVDMYPGGATLAGVCDLAGNVWEWTADKHEKYEGAFWVKGGSWYLGAERARASAAGFRSVRNDDLGLRVVCVPISHG